MLRFIKTFTFGSFLLLFVSFLTYTFLLLSPGAVYAHSTELGSVTVYHEGELTGNVSDVVEEAMVIIRSADIFDQSMTVDLCLSDNRLYPNLHPFAGGTAYAFLDKSVLFQAVPNFDENYAAFRLPENAMEERRFRLTYLLAHEFTHNLQNEIDPLISFKVGAWKLEGHAEYIARGWKADGKIQERVESYHREMRRDHVGIPVMKLSDGTIQNLAYLRYSIAVQYLMEVEHLDFEAMCSDPRSFDAVLEQLEGWAVKNTSI